MGHRIVLGPKNAHSLCSSSMPEHVLCFLLFPAWDCSAWVRTYALYLDERVECFRILKYDVEADRLLKLPQASGKVEQAFRAPL